MAGIKQKQVIRDEKMTFLQSLELTCCSRDTICSGSDACLDTKKHDSLLIRNFLLNNKSTSWFIFSKLDTSNGDSQLPGSKWLNMLSPRVILNSTAKEGVNSFNGHKSDTDRMLPLTVSLSKLPNKFTSNFNPDNKLNEASEKLTETDLRTDLRYIYCVDLCSDLGMKLQNRELKRRRRLPSLLDHTYADRRPVWYDDYCNKPLSVCLEDPTQRMETRRSVAAEYTVAYNFNRRIESVHEYHYTKRQRKEFCRRFDTGLNASSRRIKRQMKSCFVLVHRMPPHIINYWIHTRNSQRDDNTQKQYKVELLPCFVLVNPLEPAMSESKTCQDCDEFSDTVKYKNANADNSGEAVDHELLFGSNQTVYTWTENHPGGNSLKPCCVDLHSCADDARKWMTGCTSSESGTVASQKTNGLKVCTVSLNKMEQTTPSVDVSLNKPLCSRDSFDRKQQTISCSIKLRRLVCSKESSDKRLNDDTNLKTGTASISLPVNTCSQVNPVVQLKHCDFSHLSFKSPLSDRLDDTMYSLPLTPLSCTDWQTI